MNMKDFFSSPYTMAATGIFTGLGTFAGIFFLTNTPLATPVGAGVAAGAFVSLVHVLTVFCRETTAAPHRTDSPSAALSVAVPGLGLTHPSTHPSTPTSTHPSTPAVFYVSGGGQAPDAPGNTGQPST